MISKIAVVGGGAAGFIAALALKTKIPTLEVQVIRSREIGIIGVGEGSTFQLTKFLHDYLRVNPKHFFDVARPTFKLGLRFLWGKKNSFNYSFGAGPDEANVPGLSKGYGFYSADGLEGAEIFSAFMDADRAFERVDGKPKFHAAMAYHFENENFVRFLEQFAVAVGVRIVDDTIVDVGQDEMGIRQLRLQSGGVVEADLYVDCSGFASLLLGKTLGEPFVSYKSSLFCDRAVVGGWQRTEEVIKPYTTCETMNSGWCWQIEHERRINRGYVYSSDFISDEEAEREFRAANTFVGSTRVVRFQSGRYERRWVKNVVAVGNASGFVEPLEATALGLLAIQSRHIVQTLIDTDLRPTPTLIAANNKAHELGWESIRRFIAVHYKFNERFDTPFWRECRQKTDLAGAERIVDYYQQNGPASYWASLLFDSHDPFGYGGYLTMLLGQGVPFHNRRELTESERKLLEKHRKRNRSAASKAMSVRQALDAVHSPGWRWDLRP